MRYTFRGLNLVFPYIKSMGETIGSRTGYVTIMKEGIFPDRGMGHERT